MNIKKLTTIQILFILGIMIFIIPPLVVNLYLHDIFDFTNKGQIGDTIGGITAPFINAFAAILIFIAFKEQVKANDLIKEQQYFQHIQEQINRLEDDFIELPQVIANIRNSLYNSSKVFNNFNNKDKQVKFSVNPSDLNKAIYTITLFKQTIGLIDKMDYNKEFMRKKIRTLYKIIYQDNYQILDKTLRKVIDMESNSLDYVTELLFEIKEIETIFSDENVK